MDPTANRAEAITIARRFIAVADGAVTPDEYAAFDAVAEGVELAQRVIDGAEWVANGGFTPGPLNDALAALDHIAKAARDPLPASLTEASDFAARRAAQIRASLQPDRPSNDMRYAVHLDGALIDREERWYPTLPDGLREVIDGGLGPMREAIFANPDAAARLAESIKRASPDELVTIVLWFED